MSSLNSAWKPLVGFFLLSIGWNDEIGYKPANRLGRGVSEQALRTLIPARNNSVQILADDGVVGRVDDGAQQKRRSFDFTAEALLAPSESFVCCLVSRDVHQHVNAAGDAALSVAQCRWVR